MTKQIPIRGMKSESNLHLYQQTNLSPDRQILRIKHLKLRELLWQLELVP